MPNLNPALALAQFSSNWDGTTLLTQQNDGFFAAVDLSAEAAFEVGDIALIPNDVLGDFDPDDCQVFSGHLGQGGVAPTTYNGATPPTLMTLAGITCELRDPSASAPDTDGKHWILVRGYLLTVNNVGAVIATMVPARVPAAVMLCSTARNGTLSAAR